MNNRRIFGAALVLPLLMAAAGGLWAQELKFDGYLNSGLGVVADNSDADAYFKALGVDSESNGYRFRLNGSFTNEAKNAGVRFRFQSQRNLTISTPVSTSFTDGADTYTGTGNITNTYGYFSMPYAYGWVGFFENKLSLTGGIVDDSAWQTADWWWNDDQGEGLGLLLKGDPVKGLNLGLGVYVISQQSGGSNNILSIGGSLPNFRDVNPSVQNAKYTFNAAYTLPDTFRLGFSFRTKNRAGWAPDASADYPYTGREEASQLIGEFRFLGVKGLTAIVAGVLDNLESFGEKGNILFSETFAYKAGDDLNIGLNMAQFLYPRDEDADLALLFNLWGSYAFDRIVPRLDAVYFWGGQSKTVTSARQWDRRGFVPRGGQPGDPGKNYGIKGEDDDYSVFSVRPSVKFNLDSKTSFEIGDMINYDFANRDNAYRGTERSILTNVFYVDVKFSF